MQQYGPLTFYWMVSSSSHQGTEEYWALHLRTSLSWSHIVKPISAITDTPSIHFLASWVLVLTCVLILHIRHRTNMKRWDIDIVPTPLGIHAMSNLAVLCMLAITPTGCRKSLGVLRKNSKITCVGIFVFKSIWKWDFDLANYCIGIQAISVKRWCRKQIHMWWNTVNREIFMYKYIDVLLSVDVNNISWVHHENI